MFLSNVFLIFYIIIWVIMFEREKRKTYSFGPALIVILLYVIYSITSLLLYNNSLLNNYYGFGELTLFPFVYLFIMLNIALMPGMKYEHSNILYVQKPSDWLINAFIVVYGICAFVSLPSSLTTIQSGLASLFYDNGGNDLYRAAVGNYTVSDFSVNGLFGLFGVAHNMFKDFSIFVFFYYLSLKNRNRFYVIYLTLVIVVDLLISVSSGGRTSFVMMMLAILVAYFMFHDFWENKTRKIIKTTCLIIMCLITIPFALLTIGRFAHRDYSGGTIGSILYYVGEGNIYFNEFAMNANGIRYGDRTINEFKRLLGFDVPTDVFGVRSKYSQMTLNDRVYSTFVGDFVLDYGPIIALLIFIIVFAIIWRLSRTKDDSIAFHKLILVYFSLCICSEGGFYLFYYSFSRNWMIVAFILMAIVFYIDYCNQKGSHEYLKKNIRATRESGKRKIHFRIGNKLF